MRKLWTAATFCFLALAIGAHVIGNEDAAEALGNVVFGLLVVCVAVSFTVDRRTGRDEVTVVSFGPLADDRGGMVIRTNLILRALSELGIRTTVVLFAAPRDPRRADDSASVRYWPTAGVVIGSFWAIARSMRRSDTVVIMSALLCTAALYARLRGRRVVWDAQACESEYHFRVFRRERRFKSLISALIWVLLETCSAAASTDVVAVSALDRRTWIRRYPWLARRARALETAVSEAPGDVPRTPIALGDVPGAPSRVVVLMGNFSAKQNRSAALWLQGASDVHAVLHRHRARCLLIGKHSEEFSSADGTVRGIGPVDSVAPYLRIADACLAPLVDGNGLSTKMIDYFRFGRAVLATPIALCGFEVPPGLPVHVCDLPGFARALDQLLGGAGNSDAAAEMNRWAAQHFSMARFVQGVREIVAA